MTEEYLNIGSSPSEENCVQVGSENYRDMSRLECRLFKEQLQEQFPDGDFRIKSFPHDFGTYHEVVAYYTAEDEDDPRMQAAFAAEDDAWPKWTPERKAQLPAPAWPF